MPSEPHYGKGNTYAIYLYPKAQNGETEALASIALERRLSVVDLPQFAIVDGGRIPGGFWAMEVHFRGQRDDIYPKLPDDLVNPHG